MASNGRVTDAARSAPASPSFAGSASPAASLSPTAGVAIVRPATVWFSDAVDYSGVTERNPEAARRAIRAHLGAQLETIRGHGGRVVQIAGDGLMVEFADPRAALACADAVQRRVAEVNATAPPAQQMRFRIGLAAGEVIVDRDPETGREDLFGALVIVAARLEQAAEPGAVTFNAPLRGAAEALGFAMLDLGFRKLKGIDEPVRLFRIALPGDEFRTPPGEGRTPPGDDGRTADPAARAAAAAASPDQRRVRSIAVLKFATRQAPAQPEDEAAWFAEGVAEDIVGGLSRSRWLLVTSARSSFPLTDAGLSQREIADRLGVRYLVDGSVRRGRGRFRVAVRLIDADADEVVWSQSYDRPAEDLFALQDEIAGMVSASLEPAFLRHEESIAARIEPRDLAQWDLLMRARWHFWRTGRRHAVAALETARSALAMGEGNADAHAFLSFVEMTGAWSGVSPDPRESLKAALHHARRGVELDEANANAHFTLGTALSCTGRLDEAVAAERRALALNPHFSAAMGELGRLLAFRGDAAEARLHLAGAEALSPIDPTVSLWRRSAAIAAFTEGDVEGACDRQAEAVAARPDWFFHHYLHAALLAEAGRADPARTALAEGRRLMRAYPSAVMRVGHPFADAGHFDRLLRGLRAAGWNDD